MLSCHDHHHLRLFPKKFRDFRGLGKDERGGREGREKEEERKWRVRKRRLDILDGQSATNFRGGGEVRLTATRAHDSHVSLKTSLKKYVLRLFKIVLS